MPEELVKPEELSRYRQVASHVVSGWVPMNLEPGSSHAGSGVGRASLQSSGQRAVSALVAELSGLLFLPSFPSNAVRVVLHPGTGPSAVAKQQKSLVPLGWG